jgi:sigma-B regulation protein RsbU (phosphoserine phosphatase)
VKHAFFRTLPGRAIIIGLAVKIAVFALDLVVAPSSVVNAIDTVASVAIVLGAVYFVGRGIALANRRLLWKVRRKLIISYIFIGFIPSILIIAFFLLGGLFLFSNFSSYLVQNEIRGLKDRTTSIAAALALDIQRGGRVDLRTTVSRRQAIVDSEIPGVSMAVLPLSRPCGDSTRGPDDRAQASLSPNVSPVTTGPWDHVEPPRSLPEWLGDCGGFTGLIAYGSPSVGAGGETQQSRNIGTAGEIGLFASSVTFTNGMTPGYAVIVDIPIDDAFEHRMRSDTGVDLGTLRSMSPNVRPLEARNPPKPGAQGGAANGLPLTSITFFEERDWATGQTGSVIATMQLSIPDIYRRISAPASGGQSFSQSLLILLLVIGVLFLIIQGLALILGLVLARSITGSVHELFAGTERVRHGDFTHKIAIRAQDQLGELAQSFNSMTASIEDLLREQAEKKRLEEELRIAHEIQMSLLPHGPLRMPGLSVTAVCVPAREVGGDYYDFFPLDENRVGILIADVSGKGTSAALYMAELKGLMLSLSRIHTSPRDLLIVANRIIAEHLDARSFITMTYAVLDLGRRTMTYARAGHTPMIYLPASGPNRSVRVLAPDGLVLGLKIDDGEMFEQLLCEETMTIEEGDLFVLFTDGITEAMNAGDDCFGDSRLGALIEEHSHLPTEELRERVLREIAAFVGNAPQHDDMTMLLLRVGQPAHGTTPLEEGVAAEARS